MAGQPFENDEAKRIIQAAVVGDGVVFTDHAVDEMAKDDLTAGDCLNVLKGGWVESCEWENDAWRYRVLTNRITCVVEIDDEEEPTEVVTVTVWRNT